MDETYHLRALRPARQSPLFLDVNQIGNLLLTSAMSLGALHASSGRRHR
jgi:hypothetical protein